MLSFGEEAEEEEKELAAVKEKIKSSHDVLNDPRLLKEPPTNDSVLFHYLFLIVYDVLPFISSCNIPKRIWYSCKYLEHLLYNLFARS